MIGTIAPLAVSPRSDIRLSVHGLELVVRSDVPAVISTVKASYSAFEVVDPERDSDCAATTIETWSATTSDETAAILATLDRVVDTVMKGLGARDILGTHAAAVAIDGRAVVLAGRSGAGKSTLTLALLRGGARLLTDELTLVDRDDRTVLPYPRALHVSPATVDLLPELSFLYARPRHALGADLEWAVSTADLARAFGTTVAPATPLAAIVLLDERGDPSREPDLEPISRAQAAMELARGTPAAAHDLAGTIGRLGSIAAQVPAYRLRATDLASTAALLRRELGAAA